MSHDDPCRDQQQPADEAEYVPHVPPSSSARMPWMRAVWQMIRRISSWVTADERWYMATDTKVLHKARPRSKLMQWICDLLDPYR